MAIRTYKVTLDSKNTIAPEPVFLRQGDKTGAVVIDASVTDNGAPVSLSGLSATFRANTSDGKAVIADGNGFDMTNPSGGEFNYQVPNALSAVAGKITMAYFSFSDSSGSESTFNVPFVVEKSVDLTQGQAHDYITIIDGTMRTLQQKIDAMNADIQNVLNAYNRGDFYNKGETDSKDAATLNSAKSYADGKSADTLSSAKSYADTQDEKTLTSAKTYTDNRLKEASVTYNGGAGSITGYKSGYIAFVRRGNTVAVYFDVELGQMEPNWGICGYPTGFKPSQASRVAHFSFTTLGLEVKLTENTIVSQSHSGGGWWVGTGVYFTDDPFPS
ncbi:BppU family phage baseplate upper protein [Lacticaseibacillus paracasei]|uniref:BppU family phage baseplate upper protein n=1 Tax=Lacticaseibacillus paracasei TaxID=1597 RepID=UPI001C1DF09D|nr:BppU family phage baseplate upper protein [Lacticaseibacillus paracasei]MBU6046320.1 BppU family phage baseplate upper protein [Lacticaseibacillus paracasei]MCL4971155.1 BppU family phage baseplate upper protein [Lacticaseibacillus paracasei]